MQSNSTLEILLNSTNENEFKIIEWNDYRIGYFIAKNKGKSVNNEDTLFLIGKENHLAFGVSDGAGGHPRGKDAAFIAANEANEFFKTTSLDNIKEIELIETINEKVLELKAGARSTLAFATIHNDHLRSFSVGDSEIIYWNGHGNEIYSNIPHSEVGYKIEAGLLPQDESLDDPERYSVNNLLGDSSIRIEVASKMKIKKGHTVLIGSDGLFDNLSHEQLNEIVGRGSFDKSFEELCQLCINQNHELWKKDDDISFVLVRKIKA